MLRYTVYENEEAWEDMKEKGRISSAIRYAFTNAGIIHPSLEQLREAADILNVKYENRRDHGTET